MAKGIDGYSGDLMYDITRGETVSFTLTFTESDETTPIDVTDYKVYIAFDTHKDCSIPDLEVTILPQDAENGIFSGYVEDTDTFALSVGSMYCSVRYIKPDGRTFLLDKGKIKIFECVNPRLEQ